jgi:hypothetical protein
LFHETDENVLIKASDLLAPPMQNVVETLKLSFGAMLGQNRHCAMHFFMLFQAFEMLRKRHLDCRLLDCHLQIDAKIEQLMDAMSPMQLVSSFGPVCEIWLLRANETKT